jgi:hypothetical protein
MKNEYLADITSKNYVLEGLNKSIADYKQIALARFS